MKLMKQKEESEKTRIYVECGTAKQITTHAMQK